MQWPFNMKVCVAENAEGGYMASVSSYQEGICETATAEAVTCKITILFAIQSLKIVAISIQIISW